MFSSKSYECALSSETTVEIFNGKVLHYVPLRNEEHKAVFILEIISKEKMESTQKFEAYIDQIEKVLYILAKCQEELLEEHFLGIINKTYGKK